MIKPIRNQRGLALITTLLLLVLGFAVVAILLRLTARQAKLTGVEQGYTTALDAAKAGADDFMYNVQLCLNNNTAGPTNPCTSPAQGFGVVAGSGTKGGCLFMKMFNNTSTPTTSWETDTNWNSTLCGNQADATATDNTDIKNFPDITVPMGNYTVYIKIINTYISAPPASTDHTNLCYPKGCYYYTVLSQAVGNGTGEHAQVQFIYRYPKS